jgi:hypothetical protein
VVAVDGGVVGDFFYFDVFLQFLFQKEFDYFYHKSGINHFPCLEHSKTFEQENQLCLMESTDEPVKG